MLTNRQSVGRFCLALYAGLLLACGGGETEKRPTEPKGGAKPSGETGEAKEGECKDPNDPFCDPKFKSPGKTFEIPADRIKDVVFFKTPAQDAEGVPAGAGSVVIFPHKSHALARLKTVVEVCKDFPIQIQDEQQCLTCHHKELEADSAESFRKCSTCHTKEGAPPAPKSQDAMHTRCVGCHQAVVDKCPDVKFKPATECVQCHKADPTAEGVGKTID